MVAMRVVQVAVNQVVDMVAMWHGLVSATGAVYMAWLVAGAMVRRRAAVGVGCRNGNDMLIHMVAMWVVQVAVVQIINMAVVLDSRVSTTGAVLVLVRLVVGTCAGR